MSMSRAGFRRRTKKDEQENPGLRFLYSEAVAKVLWKYSSCVNAVRKRYPSSYLYKDNSNLTVQHLPHLGEHYEGLPVVGSAKDKRRPDGLLLPQIEPRQNVNTRESRAARQTATTSSGYHENCLKRCSGRGDYAFMTDRRSAYQSRRIPSILGTPPPYTFSNRSILEKLWIERIPLCRD